LWTLPLTTLRSVIEASFIPSRYGRAAHTGGKRICPAEGGVSGGGAVGAGDVALVDETRLPRNALKLLPAVADDGRSGLDTGA
jgi:hypothetical protein